MPRCSSWVSTAQPAPSKPRLALAKRLLWQLLRKPRGIAAVSVRDAHWWHVSLFETAVVTEPSQEGVRVRRLDRSAMLKLGTQGMRLIVRLVREDAVLRHHYQNAMPELTSKQNWQRLFDTR